LARSQSLSLILVLAAVGCGGSSGNSADLSGVVRDDMMTSCIQVPAWPSSNVFAFSDTTQPGYAYVDGVGADQPHGMVPDMGPLEDMAGAHDDELLYRYYAQSGQPEPQVPHDYTIPTDETLGTCVDCVTALFDFDPADPDHTGTLYFATSGTVHVSRLDHGAPTGTVAASGTALRLVHWDYDPASHLDDADPDAKCVEIPSFSFSAMFDHTSSDAGTDGGV